MKKSSGIQFREVKVPHAGGKAQVVIYGFSHGIEGNVALDKKVREALRQSGRSFSASDYHLVEGYHVDHVKAEFPGVTEDEIRIIKKGDHISKTLQEVIPGLMPQSERSEHYMHHLSYLINPPRLDFLDVKKKEAVDELKAGGKPVRKMKEFTMPDAKEVRRALDDFAARLKKDVPHATDEEISKFIVGQYTLRSLLMARTAVQRATALNGTVRVFCGFLHADEIRRFIEKEGEAEGLVGKLPEDLLRLHLENEWLNQRITESFKAHAHEIEPSSRPEFLRWVAHQWQLGLLKAKGKRIQRMEPPAISVSEFRRAGK